jgi:adenylate kinase
MNIVLLGQQGSGKGTQAKYLTEKLNLFYFETGKFLRNLAKTDPVIDDLINKQGVLVPDQQIFDNIIKFFRENKVDLGNVLFDGFPRNVSQYEILKSWLAISDKQIDLVIFLNISDEETVRRLSARRVCAKCGETFNLITNPPTQAHENECGGEMTQRPDDTPEAIKKRLAVYHRETEPLLEIFREEGILKEVDGTPDIPEVWTSIEKII